MKIDALVCAPATQESMLRGSSFDRSCSECGQRVMVSLDGQKYLRRYPATAVVCVPCVLKKRNFIAAGVLGDVRRENVVPNTWRQRN